MKLSAALALIAVARKADGFAGAALAKVARRTTLQWAVRPALLKSLLDRVPVVKHVHTGDRHTGDSARHTGDRARHTGGSARHTGGSTRQTGDSARLTGGSASFTGGSTRHTGGSARDEPDTSALITVSKETRSTAFAEAFQTDYINGKDFNPPSFLKTSVSPEQARLILAVVAVKLGHCAR